MTLLISIIIILACALLVTVVFIQNPKGGGLTGDFGTQQLGGVQRANDFVEKATWGLSITIVVLSILLSSMLKPATIKVDDKAAQGQEAPAGQQGGQGQGQQGQPQGK